MIFLVSTLYSNPYYDIWWASIQSNRMTWFHKYCFSYLNQDSEKGAPLLSIELDLYNTMTLFFLLYSEITTVCEYFSPTALQQMIFWRLQLNSKLFCKLRRIFYFCYNLFFSYNVSFIMHIFTLLCYRQSSLLFNIFVAFYSTLIRIQSLEYIECTNILHTFTVYNGNNMLFKDCIWNNKFSILCIIHRIPYSRLVLSYTIFSIFIITNL